MEPDVKICSKCKQESASELLVCQECKTVIEDVQDKKIVKISIFLSFLLSAAVDNLFDLKEHYVLFLLTNIMFILVVLYCLIKIYKKFINPKRKVLYETAYTMCTSWSTLALIVFPPLWAIFVIIPELVLDSASVNRSESIPFVFPTVLEIEAIFVYALMIPFSIFVFIFHKGRILSKDKFYKRILEKEYDQYGEDGEWIGKQYYDEYRCYFKGQVFIGVDKETFRVVGHVRSYYYAIDKNNLYRIDHALYKKYVPEIVDLIVDYRSFFIIPPLDMYNCSHYAKDKNNIYYIMQSPFRVNSLVPGRLELLDSETLINGNRIYRNGKRILPEADASTFEILSNKFGKDRNNIYYFEAEYPVALKGVDIDSFHIIDHDHVKDKNNTYLCHYGTITQI